MQIIPIASGKGGVGKSLIATNLAVTLASLGKRVVLADLDIGGSNLHLILGQPPTHSGLGTYLVGKASFDSIVCDTEYENLRFIAGDGEIPGLATLPAHVKANMIRDLQNRSDCDFFILDLGAGTHANILDMFLVSNRGLVVTDPTVTASLDAYLFIKNIIFRIMTGSFPRDSAAFDYLRGLTANVSFLQRLYIPKLVDKIATIDPKSVAVFRKRLSEFHPRLILNSVENKDDAQKSKRIYRSCKEYLGVDLEFLGALHRDVFQEAALSARLPVVKYKPKCLLSEGICRIAQKIIDSGDEYVPREMEDNFRSLEDEAEVDFMKKMEYVEDVVGASELTVQDFGEIIRSQQYEINRLKSENLLLKKKILDAYK